MSTEVKDAFSHLRAVHWLGAIQEEKFPVRKKAPICFNSTVNCNGFVSKFAEMFVNLFSPFYPTFHRPTIL